jgi:hypothetical protein
MTVYVDNMKMRCKFFRWNGTWSNLWAEGSQELIDFADRLNLSPSSMIDGGYTTERYLLTEGKREEAIRLGATRIDYGSFVMADIIDRKIIDNRTAITFGNQKPWKEKELD